MSPALMDLVVASCPPPAFVLEVGCGEGALALALSAAGYRVLATDPRAPDGPIFRKQTIDELDVTDTFDVVIADCMLHHVAPLGPALDKLARLAPLLVVGEFAWERIDAATASFYRTLRARLEREGRAPHGPEDLDGWRAAHPDLHPWSEVCAALTERYAERHLAYVPYFSRWLHVDVEAEERAAIAAGEIQPIGVRWAGVR